MGLLAVTDLVAKLGFGLYLVFNYEDIAGEDADDGMNQQSQQYV